MFIRKRVRAGVLSTVVVVAVLMMLAVLAVLALWDADFLLFSHANYMRIQRDNIESALAVYCNDPTVIDRLDADSTLTLYDSMPSSRVKLSRQRWGLYEVVSAGAGNDKVSRSVICGLREPAEDRCALWYRNNNRIVTMTGRSYVKGKACLPENGIAYGQMQSAFFSGERLQPNDICRSSEVMATAHDKTDEHIDCLFGTAAETGLYSDSITVAFRAAEPLIITAGDINDCYLSGNIIVKGGTVNIGAATTLIDVIVAADKIVVADGFRGSCQLLARDSVFVGQDVTLEFPSGIYSQKYAELGDRSELNGYMIVDYPGETEIMDANCRKSRQSRVRGLFYCRGLTQVQGIISGAAYIDRSVYYSPQGYYQDVLHDLSVLWSGDTAYPMWFNDTQKRKEIKWAY